MEDNFGPYADSIQGGSVTFLKSASSVRRWETNSLLLGRTLLQLSTGGSSGLTHGVTEPHVTTLLMQVGEFGDRVWLDGIACTSNDLVVLPPKCHFSFALTGPVRWLYCGLRADTGIAQKIAPPRRHQSPFMTEKWLVTVPRQAALNFGDAVQNLFEPGLPLHPAASEGTLFDRLEQLWTGRADVRELPSEHLRPTEEIVLRALDFAKSRLDQNLHIGDLASAADVGYRTMLRAFERYLGVSPKQYLKLCRINSVYHSLRRGEASVTLPDILAAHGVSEFGRFAGEYRSIFGEPPSATYQRYRQQRRAAATAANR